MTLLLPDDLVAQAGLSEPDALLALACWLYDAQRLDLTQAARLARLDRPGFEAALMRRGIDVYRPTAEDLRSDLDAFDRQRKAG